MPDRSKFEELWKRMLPVYQALGPLKNRAVTVCEDNVQYPLEKVVEIANLYNAITRKPFDGDTQAQVAKLGELLDALQPVENAQPRTYLWEEGNMPTETEYTDNSGMRYNHEPDFRPYLYEMLLPEDVTPKGAVVICAGGDHGESVVKGTQVAKDLNALGYQCFQLLNRTNQNPWTQKEAGVDAARAVRMVRKNAEKYRIDPRKVAFAGFSNGGLTGEGLIQYFSGKQAVKDAFPDYRPDELDELDATPAANLCIYGPRFVGDPFDYENVVYPPTFFAVGREDAAMDNLRYVYPDLKAHGVEAEVHTFAGVPHGMAGDKVFTGRVDYPNFELWIPLADAFMQDVYKKL